MSIKRTIQLLLDKASAKRVEKDTKRALDKGTDPRKAKKNLKQIEGGFSRLKKMALGIGLALGAAFITRKITQFGKEAVRVAQEAAAIWNRLAGQLRIAGVEFEDVKDQIDSTARAMQDMTVVGDEDFAAILTELLSTTNDYAASLKEVETVANLAAAKQISLVTAAQLVGRAMVGQTCGLSRYGIIVEKGGDAMEILRARFKGMAENEAKTLQGRMKQLTNEWGDFNQAIGDVMIAAGGGTSVLDTLIGTVKGLTFWVNANASAIVRWGRLIGKAVVAAFQTIVFPLRAVFNFGQVIGNILETAFIQLAKLISQGFNLFSDKVNQGIELLNRVPGVDIDFRLGGFDIAAFDRDIKASRERMQGNLEDIADSVWDLGDAYLGLGRAARDAAIGQEIVARSGIGAADAPRRPAPTVDVAPPPADVTPVDVDVAGAIAELETLERIRRAKEMMADLVGAWDAQQDTLQERAIETADVFPHHRSDVSIDHRGAGAFVLAELCENVARG